MSEQTKIALIGAAGRMGLEITKAVAARDDVIIGAAVEHTECPVLGQDLGDVAGIGKIGVTISSDLEKGIEVCDVVLDITLPTATERVLDAAVAAKTPLVCGTTGVSDQVMAKYDKAASVIPVLHTKNFSVGVATLNALVAKAVEILGEEYDIEIVEMHHRKKQDAPSGTALLLAESAAEAAGLDPKKAYNFGREGKTGERPSGQIGIHAVRGGGVFGDHTVILAGENERIELTHRAETRSLFAQGAVRSAVFVAKSSVGRYYMPDVLGLK